MFFSYVLAFRLMVNFFYQLCDHEIYETKIEWHNIIFMFWVHIRDNIGVNNCQCSKCSVDSNIQDDVTNF